MRGSHRTSFDKNLAIHNIPRPSQNRTIMAKVKKVGDEPIEKMLRRFRRECNIDGIKDDYKRSLLYEKPSVVNKRKKQEGVIESRRRMRMKSIIL